MNYHQAFEFQLNQLLEKGYATAANLSKAAFSSLITPLENLLPETNDEFQLDLETGKLSFVIVVNSELIPTVTAMSLVERAGKAGITKLFPHEATDFLPLSEEHIPQGPVYLLLHIDRGKETINLPPNQALTTIRESNRLPLTIDEGVAIVTQYPDFLQKNNCFSLLASRHTGDQRVPAIWINSQKQPNLGWCWDGNPHTWLGSASAAARVGL